MKPATEYILRNKSRTKDLILNIDSSLFVMGNDSSPIIFTFHKNCVKKWDLASCSKNDTLPPHTEFHSQDIFLDKRIIASGTIPFSNFINDGIPIDENDYHPMDEEIFNYYFDSFLKFETLHNNRFLWLWDCFINTYKPEESFFLRSKYPSIAKEDLYANEKYLMELNNSIYIKYWEYWRNTFIINPSEHIFYFYFSA